MNLLLGVFMDITLIIITLKVTRLTVPILSRSHIWDKEWSTVRLLYESMTISLSSERFLKLRIREINNRNI